MAPFLSPEINWNSERLAMLIFKSFYAFNGTVTEYESPKIYSFFCGYALISPLMAHHRLIDN